MPSGVSWISMEQLTFSGYSITFARGISPEGLAERLAEDGGDAVLLGSFSGEELDDLLDDADECAAVRYGKSGLWSYAVAYGGWPGEVGPTYGPGVSVSRQGVELVQLYSETENPKLPPAVFSYAVDGIGICMFDMAMREYGSRVGTRPDLLDAQLSAAGVMDESDRDMAERGVLAVIEEYFGLDLPQEVILNERLPAMLIRGRLPQD